MENSPKTLILQIPLNRTPLVFDVYLPQSSAMKYPAVGICIYCGAKKYSIERRRLGDEHIIPLAANGDLILPEASCSRCEKLNQKPEEQMLMMSGKAFRVMHKYRSRNKLPKTLPLYNINGTGEKREVPAEYYPNGFALMLWPRPWVLSGATHNTGTGTNFWCDLDRLERDRANLAKLGIHSWACPEMKNEMVFRMFAKIGHSYLTAKLGVGGFRPLLLDYILRLNDTILHLIGGTELPETPTDSNFTIGWKPEVINNITYAVVSVRLFAKQMGPTYLVVAGELKSSAIGLQAVG